MADQASLQDDERDDELFREVYSKEYTGPPGPIIKPGTRPQPPARKRSYDSDDDEKDRERDPYGVPRDFTSREARTWEARNRAIEKQQKRKLEEELRCKICGEMGHFAQGCPNTLGPPRALGARQGEDVEKILLQDQRLKSRIIGAKGAVIQGIEKESGCRLRLEDNPAGGDNAFFVRIIGKKDAISKAVEAIRNLVAQYEEEKKSRPLGNGPPPMRNQGVFGVSMDARAGIPSAGGPGRGGGAGQSQGRGVPLGMRGHGPSGRGNSESWGLKEQFGGSEISRQQEEDRGGPASGYREGWVAQQWPPRDYGLEKSYDVGEPERGYGDPRGPPAGGTIYKEQGYIDLPSNVEQKLASSRDQVFDARNLEGMSPEELDRWLQEELMRVEAKRVQEEDMERSRHQQALEELEKKSAERVSEVRARHAEVQRLQYELRQQQQQQQYSHLASDQGYYSSAYAVSGYSNSEHAVYGVPYGGPPSQGYAGERQSAPQNGTEAYTQAGYEERVEGGAQMFGGSSVQGTYGTPRVGNGQDFVENQRGGHVYQQETVYEAQPPQEYMGRSGYLEGSYDGGSLFGYRHESNAAR